MLRETSYWLSEKRSEILFDSDSKVGVTLCEWA